MNSAAFGQGSLSEILRQGGTAYAAGRYGDALTLYESVLSTDHDHETALLGVASCQHALADLPSASASFQRLADLYPAKPAYRYNQGYSLLLDARYDEAAPILRECIGAIDDPHVKANLAIALQHSAPRDLASASRLLEEAAALLPGDADVQRNLAFLWLSMGDYEAGWPLHERRATLQRAVASTTTPVWRGESLAAKTLGLWSEQGLGDSLQFVRYLPLVARRAFAESGSVIFQPPTLLYRLFKTSFADWQSVVEILSRDDTVPPIDFHCSLMSLPALMHTRPDDIPASVPYLHADAGATERWRARLEGRQGLKVGLVWAGDSHRGRDPFFQRSDRRRSVALEQLSPLFDIPNVTFVSLQKGEPARQVAAMPARGNFIDDTAELDDFADTAALAANLDLVITVDTSVCHLAGSLGIDTWLMNRWDPCWRWLIDRDDSPWYPTLKQYRQTRPGDWSDVIARIANDLAQRARGQQNS